MGPGVETQDVARFTTTATTAGIEVARLQYLNQKTIQFIWRMATAHMCASRGTLRLRSSSQKRVELRPHSQRIKRRAGCGVRESSWWSGQSSQGVAQRVAY